MKRAARDSRVNELRAFEGASEGASEEASKTKMARPAWPKRKVALMLGYSGAGYQGMQL